MAPPKYVKAETIRQNPLQIGPNCLSLFFMAKISLLFSGFPCQLRPSFHMV